MENVWQIVGIGCATFIGVALVVAVLAWLYNRREKRRKHALALAKLMNKYALDWFADLYEMYAVGDYSGLSWKVKEVIEAVRTDEMMIQKLDGVFWKVLDFYKDQPAKLAEIRKKLPAEPAAPAKAA